MAIMIFDLDGTLIDSAPDIRACANIVLEREGRAALDLAQTRSFIGEGAPVFVRHIMNARGIADTGDTHSRLLAAFLELYDTAHELTRPYPGAAEALGDLQHAGYRLALCTNKPERPARAALAHFGLDRFFPVVTGGDTLPTRKPDPASLLHTRAQCGSGKALYIGDSEIDSQAARAAGIPFILFTEGYRKGPVKDVEFHYKFRHYNHLKAIVDALSS